MLIRSRYRASATNRPNHRGLLEPAPLDPAPLDLAPLELAPLDLAPLELAPLEMKEQPGPPDA